MLAAAPLLRRAAAQTPAFDIHPGPFKGTRESLQSYKVPDWYRDAKFGIWAHWGPQSAPEQGDWYARRMYIEGEAQYQWHKEHFGPQSKVGFKDVIPTFKGEKFDPEHLLDLYQKAGAKYFVSMGVHHDNFDMWNSKHTRWNAVNMGPKKDVVGMFRQAALKRGLKFGVSEHLWISWKWFGTSHDADAAGEFAGVPYDGTDPSNFDLYHDLPANYGKDFSWDDAKIPDTWKRHWFDRIKDLVDNYQPDLLYTDGAMPFEEYGMNLVAHLYNSKPGAVYTSKRMEDCEVGTCVLDFERGLPDAIHPNPWQTDTCVGDWHYKRDITYKTPKTVIDMLVDIVSRNGNLLLNFPLPGSGEPDSRELAIVSEITKWMDVNSEGIYGTRPYKMFGEGPSSGEKSGPFNEKGRQALTAQDIRYTTKGKNLYAFVMGWPDAQAIMPALTESAVHVRHVELLGYKGRVKWSQDANGMTVALPGEKPSDYAVAIKIERA
ncbi:MAG TPA: alpha-L-fucosidase [Bryobacteraceae bacterium]|nr:alpha-L-fucosidase [Bryobacteraceae bacterium]